MRTLRNRITMLAALAVTAASLLASASAGADTPGFNPGAITSTATPSGIQVCVTKPSWTDYADPNHRSIGGGTTCFTISG
jgi:hypothetical protein